MKAWKISIIVIIILAVVLSLYVYSLYHIKIEDVQVNALQDVSLSGFTVGGNISVHNGGLLPVGVDKIEYSIVLEDSGNELASGIINGSFVMPAKTAEFPFLNSIKWVPTAEIAVNMLTGGNTYVKITGDATVISDIKLPFEKRIDLKPYITQFAKQKVQEIVSGNINETAQKVVEWIKTI